MTRDEYLKKLLKHYEKYYDIITENVIEPFSAFAEFHSHSEQYALVKSAKLAEIDSNEYVYFYCTDSLSLSLLQNISQTAWNNGLSRIKPSYNHRNSDITLLVIADKIDADALKNCRKIKYYKSYKFGIYGWSNFRLVVYELTTSRIASNRLGKDLRKYFA